MADYLVAVDALTVPVPGSGGRFRLLRRGAVFSSDNEAFVAPHVRRGSLVSADEIPVEPAPGVDVDEVDQPENVADVVEPAPVVVEDAEGAEKPAKAAHIDVWRKYAETKGIATKGLTKQELIAATR